MKLERLALAGFTRFTDRAELDLTTIPDGSLVAIVGVNGSGKSTLLDAGAAVLHLAMPSRAGGLADYATSRASYLEATYSIEGRGRYRARVNVDGQQRNSDAVLEHDGQRLTDGKVTTYRKAISEIFPAPEVLLASAFAPQNRAGSFVDAKPAQRKDLFSALLGLQQLERYAETAKACVQLVEMALGRLRERRDVLGQATTQARANDLAQRRGAADRALTAAEQAVILARAAIAPLETRRGALEGQARAHQVALAGARAADAQVAATETELQGLAQRRQDARTDADRRSQTARANLSTTRTRLEADQARARAACETLVADRQRRIDGNQTLLDQADDIRRAVTAKAETERELADLREQEGALRRQHADALQQVSATRDLWATAAAAARELEQARRQASLIGQVPCRGVTMFIHTGPAGDEAADASTCQFLADARAASARVPELETAAAPLLSLGAALEQWKQRAAGYSAELSAIEARIAGLVSTIAELGKTTSYAEALAAAEERIASLQREQATARETLEQALQGLVEALTVAQADTDLQLAAAGDALTARLEAIRQDAESLTARLDQAKAAAAAAALERDETIDAAAALDDVDRQLAAARDTVTTTAATLATRQAEHTTLAREQEGFTRAVAEHAGLVTRVTTLEDELLAWQLLQRGFSRDGLPTLEIGNAGPTVSTLTNDLLSVAFGPRFTVEVVTQVARADGKGLREDFTIRVFDNQHGGEPRDIADLSGGERVLVEEALRAAIALFVNSRNVQPIRTVFRDETTGALDPENAVRYVSMLRRLMELGGIAHVLFVTHAPNCAALADAQVHVVDGTLRVVRPPYVEAA